MEKINSGLSSILDLSRWVAALAVLIHHVRHILLIEPKDAKDSNFLIKILYFFTGLGHEAVVVFFVVSGLLVGALTLEKWKYGVSKGILDYFIHRFSRIYIVFIPALIVGFGLDYIGMLKFDDAELYSNSSQYNTTSLNLVIKENLGFDILLGNLFMLQTIIVRVVGSNGPLWSLAYEWWYYCLWILIIGFVYRRGLSRWFCGVLFVCIIIFLPYKILLWMLVWLLGVLSYYYGKSDLPKLNLFVSLALFMIGLIISRICAHFNVDNVISRLYFDLTVDMFLGVFFAVFLASCYKLEKPLVLSYLHARLASFSYSLYLVHFPAMVLIIAIFNKIFRVGILLQPDQSSILYFVFVVVVLYLYAYLFSLLTEKHTFKLIGILRKARF
jgi:peptidoglycan/LPS O-acetylase OafA/YrhL